MHLHCANFQLDISRPLVMGIINVTPDSFSDGGKYLQRDAALVHAHQLIQDGADILDIGGESSRPGANAITAQQELDRIMPILEGLRGASLPLSVDTHKPEVMRAALAAGASMINDINALQDSDAVSAVAETQAAVCLMHMQGNPQTMQQHPAYQDVVSDVLQFLRTRLATCAAAGIAPERIMVDPGFGFGKTLEHNLALLQRLEEFSALGVPVMAGLSRKSMLRSITGRTSGLCDHASVAAALLAVQRGARIVRVHDVAATVEALKVWSAVNWEQ